MTLLTLLSGGGAALGGESWNPEQDLPEEERLIITPQEFRGGVELVTDRRLIEYLDQHPEDIRTLTPRRFEELVAELLRQSGYSVQLGARGADGGVDVYAERTVEFGPELVLVQCKKNREDRRVGEPIIKQLYGDVEHREASRGLLVTTSSFTSNALAFIERVRYRLAGTDFDRLKQWIANVRRDVLRTVRADQGGA